MHYKGKKHAKVMFLKRNRGRFPNKSVAQDLLDPRPARSDEIEGRLKPKPTRHHWDFSFAATRQPAKLYSFSTQLSLLDPLDYST